MARKTEDSKIKILEMLDSGKISADEAVKLLAAMAEDGGAETADESGAQEFGAQNSITRSFSAHGKTELRIRNISGHIAVEAREGDQIELTAQRHGSQEVRLVIEDHGDALDVKVADPAPSAIGRLFGTSKSPAVSFTVSAPPHLVLRLTSINGRVAARGFLKDSSLSSTNGSLSIEKMSGRIEARTHNGSITGRNLTPGHVSAVTANGSIRLGLTETSQGMVETKTMNGSIAIFVPENPSISLLAKTENGSIRTDFPVVTSAISGRKVEGKIGNGKMRLDAKTMNGRIAIEPLEKFDRREDHDDKDASEDYGIDLSGLEGEVKSAVASAIGVAHWGLKKAADELGKQKSKLDSKE